LPDGGNRADLCQALTVAHARVLGGLPASEWARSRETERPPWNAPRRNRATSRARRTVWTVISEATCQPTIVRLVASTNTDVGHPFGGADGGEVRDREGVRTFRPKDPLNEVGGDVGAAASLSSPLGDARHPPHPGYCHEPGDLVPPDFRAARCAAMTWDPRPQKFACGRATRMGIRTASPLPSRRVPARCLHIGVRVSGSCGRWARRSSRCSEAGEGRCGRSLRLRRTPRLDIGISFARRSSRFSVDHGCVRSRPRSPRDRASQRSASRPTPVRLRPEAELVCHR